MLPGTDSLALMEIFTDHITPYHYTALNSAISHMLPAGRELIKIVLKSPAEMYDFTSPTITLKPHNLKLYLREIGWSTRKINQSFASIRKMLDEI